MIEHCEPAKSAPSRRALLRDPAAQAEFVRNGFVTMPMLAPAEVTDLAVAAAALRPNDAFDPQQPNFRLASYHCSFLDGNRDYRRSAFALISRFFAAHVERALIDFRIVQCNFYVKPPGRGAFDLHQNWPITTDLDETSLSIWCPLTDVSAHNGAIAVVPGSHKILPHVQSPDTHSYLRGMQAELWASGLVETLSLQAGTGVIFDDGLIHGSSDNRSDTPRFAVQLICVPTESTPVYYRDLRNGRFEMARADVDFWFENDVGDLIKGKPDWEILGVVENRNRPIGFEELREMLAHGDELRQTSIALKPVPDTAAQRTAWLPRWLQA